MRRFKKILSCVIATVMAVSLVPAGAFAAPESGVKITAEDAAREFIKSGTGLYLPETANSAEAEEFPSSFDLRAADLDGSGEKKNYVTPVKNQGNFGACWGFSAIAATESSILSETGLSCDEWEETYGDEMDLSEHHLAWFAFVPLPSGSASRQDGEGTYVPGADEDTSRIMNAGGLTATATSVFSCGIGPMLERDYPYRGKEGNIMYLTPDDALSYTDGEGYMPYCYSDKDDWSIDESERFGQVAALEESFLIPASAQFERDENTGDYKFVFNQEAVNSAKKQLMLGRPLQIGYCSDPRFTNEETWAHYSPTSQSEDPLSSVYSDHQVTVVGWDDDYPRENFCADNELPPENGAWIIKNSYGAESREFPDHDTWGDDGYFYLSYYDHTIDSYEAVDFDTSSEYRNSKYYDFKYNYLPANPDTQYHLYDEPCYMANNFLTYYDRMIRTLAFQTNTPNTTTTFEVYKLNEKSETPTDGELIASETKTFELGGYHRVDLAEPLYIPADTVFSVVVTNKTADGKYELVSDRNEGELISRSVMASSFDSSYPYVYAKSVVNPGESYLGSTAGDGSVSWNDWSDVLSEGEQMGTDFLKSIGYLDLLESTEQMIDEYETALSGYRAEHPDAPSDELPEEIAALQDKCYSNAAMLDRSFNSIMNGDYDGLDLTDEQLENANNQAFYVNDNFPISVIADPVADYALYYDPESGFHKNSKDGEAIPSEKLPDGITADGNVVTLTSDFQFVTTNSIGLALSDGVTLKVPEGESPSIKCALSSGGDPRAFGIFASGDVTLEIDGDLAVTAEGTENAINTALCSDGDITIIGSGVLTLSGGLMCDTGALTVGGGSRVTAKNEKGYIAFSTACMTGDLTVKDGSSLEIAASDPENKDCAALIICGSANEAGEITLKNNASLTIASDGIGIMPLQADTRAVADIDSSCVFTAEGDPAVSVELQGVRAVSDGTLVRYDNEKQSYVDADGENVKKLSFYPRSSSQTGGSGGGTISESTFSTSGSVPTAAPAPTAAPTTAASVETAQPSEGTAAAALPFTDVKPSDWFYDAVCAAYNKGLINGVSDTEFGPDMTMTRGMLVAIIGRIDGNTQSSGALFGDVDPNEYYAPYVAWAAENGIVNGFEDGAFRPDESVTREQTAAILYRYMQYKGADVSAGENTNILSFTDAGEISEYAVPAIQWACGAGVINGYPDGSLAPAASITRAEFVKMLAGIEPQNSGVDYSDMSNWAYFEHGNTDKAADVFFVCPTVYLGGDNIHNMSLTDEKTKASFLGATNMEKGIYDDDSRFFAPYYRQAGLDVYTMDESEREKYLASAYEDVKDAFEYYYKNVNGGRPIILAGFSQGGDMCIRLVRDYFADNPTKDQLVACYAIGWRLTENDTKKYPQLKFAAGESDTGVIISFTCEADNIDNSIIIPKDTKSLAINPLNWKTDSTPADKSLNLGACFTDYDGNITKEAPALTGAYIDSVRGALKVTDVTPEEYPPGLDVFESGVYHLYDYQFFYRNLEKNVKTRLDAYAEKHS